MAHECDRSPSHLARNATSCFSKVRSAFNRWRTRSMCSSSSAFAGLVGRGRELEQLADLGQRNVERPAVADELQALQMTFCVAAVAGVLALGLLEQTLSFVEPNGLNVASGLCGQLTDLHRISQCFAAA